MFSFTKRNLKSETHYSCTVAVPETPSWLTIVNGKPRLVEPNLADSSTLVKQPIRRKIVGCCSSSVLKIKSSRVNPSSWHIFLGKLEPGTTEQDVKDHLADHGILVSDIVKLRAVEKWQEKVQHLKFQLMFNLKVTL